MSSLEVKMPVIGNLQAPPPRVSGDDSSSLASWRGRAGPPTCPPLNPVPALQGVKHGAPRRPGFLPARWGAEETGLDRVGELRASSAQSSQLLFIQLLPEIRALPSVPHLTLAATPPGMRYHPHHMPRGAARTGQGRLRPAPPPDAEGTCAHPSPHPGSHRGLPAAGTGVGGLGLGSKKQRS